MGSNPSGPANKSAQLQFVISFEELITGRNCVDVLKIPLEEELNMRRSNRSNGELEFVVSLFDFAAEVFF